MNSQQNKSSKPSVLKNKMVKPKPTKKPTPPGGSREACRVACGILQVLGGAVSPPQAAESLGLSLQRYYLVEQRALQGLIDACEPAPKGPRPNPAKQLEELRRENKRLQAECARFSALVRAAQRTVGLSLLKPEPAAPKKSKGKRRRRKPAVRALKALERIRPDEPEADSSVSDVQDSSESVASAATPLT